MSGFSILVVDDEASLRRTLRANLAARGYEVRTAETGEEALALVVEQPPSLVILDLMLPGLSGLEVCRALRAASLVLILVLSARGEEPTKVRALDLGADDYLTKPFGMDELLARVRALLRRPLTGTPQGAILQSGALRLDQGARRAWRNEVMLPCKRSAANATGAARSNTSNGWTVTRSPGSRPPRVRGGRVSRRHQPVPSPPYARLSPRVVVSHSGPRSRWRHGPRRS